MTLNLQALRALYPAPKERTLRNELNRLDPHCQRFIELSPFVVLASTGADGALDASPRGGAPAL
jgi:predicted pyridoxine 5'-phosphate oxidase superfamily flavin-nucleotide-binding protein